MYVGCSVSDKGNIDPAYSIFELPASKYASFDVYVSSGYESENSAMDEWLKTNDQGYSERKYKEGESRKSFTLPLLNNIRLFRRESISQLWNLLHLRGRCKSCGNIQRQAIRGHREAVSRLSRRFPLGARIYCALSRSRPCVITARARSCC